MRSDCPAVSVVIATRDRPEYLRCAIASVLGGTFQDFEIIVTDDAGSESNCAVVRSFCDPRIRYRRNQARLGSALNHSQGLRLASGRYVGLLNDDDEWEAQFLERMVSVLEHNPGVVIAFADHWVMRAGGEIDLRASEECTHRFKRDVLEPGLHEDFQRIALIDQSIAMVAALVRREPVEWENCPAEVSSLYDFWVAYLAVRTGMAAYYRPERLARYRVHERNESAIGSERFVTPAVFVYQRMLCDSSLAQLWPDLRLRLRDAHVGYGIFLLRNGAAVQSWRQFAAGLPQIRAAAGLVLSLLPRVVRARLLR